MQRTRRTARAVKTAASGSLGRTLAMWVLLIGFLAAQGAALTHTHVDAADHAPCTVCRVADDAAQAIDALPSANFVLQTVVPECVAPAIAPANDPVRSAHPPRAPPIV